MSGSSAKDESALGEEATAFDDRDESLILDREPRPPQMTRLGRYRLVREIASGGMASVNLAVADGVDKLVALKLIHRHLAQEDSFVEMFLDEARIASSIAHRNVCNVFDFGEADERYYIAMDYLAGQSLRDVILRLRKLPDLADPKLLAVYAAYILAEACEGLHAAHELRGADGEPLHVVHRDVSPHNLFVTYDGSVSVVDFGIARASDRIQHTATGVLKGKFSYMAPEQIRQLEVDRRADVWALGVCLWETLTLERLFVRSSQADTLMSVMMDRVKLPSEVRPDLPKELDAIVAHALARNPAQRYETARELGRDLMAFVRKSEAPVGMVEVEQWMEQLFPKELADSRRLIQNAKLASIEEAQWHEGTPSMGFSRMPTRSGAMLRARSSRITGEMTATNTPASQVVLQSSPDNDLSPPQTLPLLEVVQPVDKPQAGPARKIATLVALAIGTAAALYFGLAREGTGSDPTLSARLAAALQPSVSPASPATPAPVAPSIPEQTTPTVDENEAQLAEVVVEPPVAEPVVEVSAPIVEETEDADSWQARARPRRRAAPVERSTTAPQASVDSASAPRGAQGPAAATPVSSEAVVASESTTGTPTSRTPKLPSPGADVSVSARATEPSAPRVASTSTQNAPQEKAPQPSSSAPVRQVLDGRPHASDVNTQGSLGSGVVLRMLSRAEPLMQRCYVSAAQRAGKNEYRPLSVALTINEMGAVRSVTTGRHPLPGLSDCVNNSLKRLRSDRKPDVGTVSVEYSLEFRAP
jgi:serine/threonine-protein kinase